MLKVSNVSGDGAKGKKISQLIRKRRRPLAPGSWAQEFDSLIVLNVPCWHSGGMLQRLDPVSVWVYGLRCSGGRPRRTDVCKAQLFLPMCTKRFFLKTGPALTSGLLLFIFLRSGIFNRDLYKYEKSSHIFCCPYPGTLGAFHWREASLEVKCVWLHAGPLRAGAAECLLWAFSLLFFWFLGKKSHF